MSSRAAILSAIREKNVPNAELPSLDQAWIQYPDAYEQFSSVLNTIGGRCFTVGSTDEMNQVLNETPAYAASKKVVSTVPGVGQPNVYLETVADAYELEPVDFAIVPGYFGVAENGAIWVTDEHIKHRTVLFIAQHLAIIIPRDQILNNMHEAYKRLSFTEPRFGAFISGPSKTADIEQSLVIGAHGPRSLTVFCTT